MHDRQLATDNRLRKISHPELGLAPIERGRSSSGAA
jgi:hypothetical protein